MTTSIIIPVYKTPPELFAACMESVLAWPGEEVEFILVIDSPGHAIEKDVYACAERDHRVRVLRNEENRGPSYSRNRGIDAASGDYVMMVDADDRIIPSVCQKALDCCREKHLAYCAVARVYPWQKDGVDSFETHQLYTGSFENVASDQLVEVLPRLDMSSSGVWFDRAFLNERHLRYPEDLRQNEDFVFTTSILSAGAKVGIWDEYGYTVTLHAGSLSQNKQNTTFHTHQLVASQRIMQLIGSCGLPCNILQFYANHAYNQIFATWHSVSFDSQAMKLAAVRDLGLAAKTYFACYSACLRLPAKLVIAFVSRFPGTMFRRPPLINYIFRALRKFDWYFNSAVRLGLSTSTKKQPKPIYLYLTPCFPSPESWRGGFCYDAVKALMRDGRYDVRVMTSSPGADYDYHGIHVYRFHKFALGCSDYLPFLTNPFKIHYFAKKLKAMGLKPSDIAVCHVHLFENYAPYATWLKRKNPKCLTLLHHHWTGKHGLSQGKLDCVPGIKELLYLYTRKHLEAADAQIFCSEVSKAAFARYFPNGELAPSVDMKVQLHFPRLFRSVRLGNSLVCYNGIDSTLFRPAPSTPHFNSETENHHSSTSTLNFNSPSTSTPDFDSLPQPPTSTYRIGCIGNFTPQKSQKTLIEAIGILTQRHRGTENIHVTFIGSGSQLESCKRLAQEIEKKINHRCSTSTSNFDSPSTSALAFDSPNSSTSTLDFNFLKEMPHDNLPAFYHSLDLFVLPSYYEAFNCVFVEALGCGIPIIGCDNVSIREVISSADAKKWLFPPRDAKALADRIDLAMRERPKCQQLTRDLDIDVVTSGFLNWVDSKINILRCSTSTLNFDSSHHSSTSTANFNS